MKRMEVLETTHKPQEERKDWRHEKKDG